MDTTQNPSTPAPAPAPAPAEQATGSRKRLLASWVKHPVTIGLAAGTGVLALVGGTIVIADEIAEEVWPDRYYVEYLGSGMAVDDSSASSTLSAPLQPSTVEPLAPVEDTATDVPAAPTAPATPTDASSQEAREFIAAVDAAVAAADGVGVTEIAVTGGGFELDVLLSSGREIDVAVLADGSTVVDRLPYPDSTSDPALDRDRIEAILDAARAALGTSDAAAVSLSTEASPGTRYDVEFATPSGTFWVELSADLAVVEVDSDW
ncbi:hypothetical protein HDC37_002684 [Microbacterium sp. AK009]|uniref:hypothetical protein n=1 Tax=Microbacterium sp. AK009 TaxID=2723068 RepID=UPI0015C82949|nr:hypothetical protein [Microbacterium sp. AK009]NYF17839.1 hypothetical protein [Microbacterium sp. AK009]